MFFFFYNHMPFQLPARVVRARDDGDSTISPLPKIPHNKINTGLKVFKELNSSNFSSQYLSCLVSPSDPTLGHFIRRNFRLTLERRSWRWQERPSQDKSIFMASPPLRITAAERETSATQLQTSRGSRIVCSATTSVQLGPPHRDGR
jgi:hypothetical protein